MQVPPRPEKMIFFPHASKAFSFLFPQTVSCRKKIERFTVQFSISRYWIPGAAVFSAGGEVPGLFPAIGNSFLLQ
jgi:hypothetical protein